MEYAGAPPPDTVEPIRSREGYASAKAAPPACQNLVLVAQIG